MFKVCFWLARRLETCEVQLGAQKAWRVQKKVGKIRKGLNEYGKDKAWGGRGGEWNLGDRDKGRPIIYCLRDPIMQRTSC